MADQQTPNRQPSLRWRRWARGGGQYAWHPAAGGQLYSLMPVRTARGSYTGRYELTDFHHRSGRCVVVVGKDAGYALAEEWFAAGPPDDGYARMRAAWGTWHEQVPAGHVGVTVALPATGEKTSGLVTKDVYDAAQADPESRIPLEVIDFDGFQAEATTKQVAVSFS